MDERYELRGVLGQGGEGVVLHAWDNLLDRSVALKVLPPPEGQRAEARSALLARARLAARLEHPSIVPVHDAGWLPDGRFYLVMRKVEGRTLGAVLAAVEASSGSTSDGWTRRRLVDAVQRVAEAAGYAHARGVCHLDLTPSNVLLGGFGEVSIIDWGLAAGQGGGTPGFAPPEQLAGALPSPTMDVYAVGRLLHAIVSPIAAPDSGYDDLLLLALEASAEDPADRFPDGRILAFELSSWLDGARRREAAQALVAEGDARMAEAARRRARAEEQVAEAEILRSQVPRWTPVEDRAPLWAAEDAAASEARAASEAEDAALEAWRAALRNDPAEPGAHARLAGWHRASHAEAEARGAPTAARELRALRAHDRGEHRAYLEGRGALHLSLEPPVPVRLLRYTPRGRVWVPEPVAEQARADRYERDLPIGSYLVEAGRVRYPVQITRLCRWEGTISQVDPGPEAVWVPPGPAWIGGPDPSVRASYVSRRAWLDGFVLRRDPVTNADYLSYLNALVAEGRRDEALALAPRHPGSGAEEGALVYGPGPEGGFALVPDAEGDLWRPDWPVVLLRYAAARAYADWCARKTGLPWRLPEEWEWEKAARGVDGRAYPWGDQLDPSFANMRWSRPGRPLLDAVDAFPTDTSPYGARGMAGNTADWTATPFLATGPRLDADGRPRVVGGARGHRTCKGGAWSHTDRDCRTDARWHVPEEHARNDIGLRLARDPVPADHLPRTSVNQE